jgi:alpha-L-rhamnosidase
MTASDVTSPGVPAAPGAPGRLRAEHLDRPLGIGERRPRLSWRLPWPAAAQYGYRLVTADGADTGWVPGQDSVLVPWPFAPLGSAERVTVRVAVRTDLGESPFSDPLTVEAGLLSAADNVAGPGHHEFA